MEPVGRWWDRVASPRVAYAIAATIGLGSFVAIYGPGFVLGTSSYWEMPTLDHRMAIMGYRYFEAEPWHWPLFAVHTALPDLRSIAFSDTPLAWATIHKLVATAIPPWGEVSSRAILGLWYGVVTTLQPVLAVACLRALGRRTIAAAIVVSMFAIAIPAWTYRMPHASLCAHFFLLWALYLYLARRPATWWLVQLAVVAASNAYLTTMSLAVFAAALAQARIRRERSTAHTLASLAAALVIVGIILGVAGYFSTQGAASLPTYPLAGSNLLGPLLPLHSGWFGTRLWVDVTGSQYEGVCYLGLGVIILTAIVLRWGDVRETLRRHLALAIVCGVMIVLALSNHIYLGPHRLLAYPLPRFLQWIAGQFRCPGRFSWLPVYVLVMFVLARGHTRLVGRWRWLLPVLAIVQLVDVSGDWAAWRGAMGEHVPFLADATSWRTLIASSSAVEVYPAFDCYGDRDFDAVGQVQYWASEYAIPINSNYTARRVRDCDADTNKLVAFTPTPHTLYVFVAPTLGLAKRLAATTQLRCIELGVAEVCTSDQVLLTSVGGRPTPPPTELHPGEQIELADPTARFLELGWASAEADGRWTEGPTSRLVFRPLGTPSTQLQVDAHAMICGTRTVNDLDVSIAGTRVGSMHFTSPAPQTATFEIPASLLATPIVELELAARDHRSPHAAGCRSADREIAVKVTRVWFGPRSP